MARHPRYFLPGYPQHVIQRGNNRNILFASERDYRFYLEKLDDACRRHGCRRHAYVLMTNHVHLLVTPDAAGSISKAMQSLGRYYVPYYNCTHGRTGTLWEDRFKATLVDTDRYLLTCYRYIEQNPLRAGLVASAADYPWSSHRHNALGEPDPLVCPHESYLALGATDSARQQAHRGLFEAPLQTTTLASIREATNKGWVLGNGRFRERIETLIERQTAPRPRGGDRRSTKYRAHRRINRV